MQKTFRSSYGNTNRSTKRTMRIPVLVASILVPAVIVASMGTFLETIAISGIVTHVSTILFCVGIACIAMYLWTVGKTLLIFIHGKNEE